MAQLAENSGYRSPVSLSLLGLPTIHALRIPERVTQDFHYYQDQHSAAWYHYTVASRWLETSLSVFAVLIAISIIMTALITHCILEWDQLLSFSLHF